MRQLQNSLTQRAKEHTKRYVIEPLRKTVKQVTLINRWKFSGVNREMDPPGLIPNPAVKHLTADGTTKGIRGRVGRCRNYVRALSYENSSGLFCVLGIYQVVSPSLTELEQLSISSPIFVAIFPPIASPFLLSAQSRPKRSLPRPSLQKALHYGQILPQKFQYEGYSWESRSIPELCKSPEL